MFNQTKNLNQNSNQNKNQKRSSKKEPFSLMTVKTLLAILLFTGMVVIIIGGGYIIGGYYKAPSGDKTIQQSEKIEKGRNKCDKNILIDFSDYEVVTTSDNFNLVIIDDFDLLFMNDETPVLPYKTYTVNFPKDTEIKTVDVIFSDQIDLGKLNIPAYVPPDPMGMFVTQHYVPLPVNIGIFPEEQYRYRVIDGGSETIVIIDIIPVTFNSETQQTKIYKSADICIQYSAYSKGIFDGFWVNKDVFHTGDIVKVSINIQNTSPKNVTYYVNIEMRDHNDNVVKTANNSLNINSNTSDIIITDILAPKISENYKVIVSVSDGENEMGEFDQMIKVIGAQITHFDVPEEIVLGDYGTFTIGVENFSSDATNAFVDIYVYERQYQVAKLVQFVIKNIEPDKEKEFTTHWYPSHLEPGEYLIQAVVSIDDYEFSEMKTITIVQ